MTIPSRSSLPTLQQSPGTTAGIGVDHQDGIRQTTERLEIAGAPTTAYDPAFDPDGRTISAVRAVVLERARSILSQPASRTG